VNKETIAILGGTGNLGLGLAARWMRAGYPVIMGSRTLEKARAAVEEVGKLAGDAGDLSGMPNPQAAECADIVVLTVPFAHQLDTLESVRAGLAGKILVDTTVPLVPPRVARVHLPEGGSAVARAQAFLGPAVQVVGALQNVAADLLRQLDTPIECDVLVTGDSKAARARVLELVTAAGMRGWHAGPVANSAAVEALTCVLIHINNQGILEHAGIRITGQPHVSSGPRAVP